MPTLHFALMDGFSNDTMTITVNGTSIFAKSGITTDLTLSFADRAELRIEEGDAHIEITVPSRNVRGSLTVQPEETPSIIISLSADGNLQIIPKRDPIYFM